MYWISMADCDRLEGDGACGEVGVKRNRFEGYGVASCRSVQGSIAGFCEGGNE